MNTKRLRNRSRNYTRDRFLAPKRLKLLAPNDNPILIECVLKETKRTKMYKVLTLRDAISEHCYSRHIFGAKKRCVLRHVRLQLIILAATFNYTLICSSC